MGGTDVVLYVSKPYQKYRWIGFVSTIQISFVLASLVLMPTNRIMKERQIALKNTVRKKEEDPNQVSLVVDQQQNVITNAESSTLWQRIQHLNYLDLFSPKNIKDNIADRPYFSMGMLSATSLITFALFMYARRMAHIITLLPKERIRFESFSTFALGKPPSIELAAKDISCVVGRESANNYSILKFKGCVGYHLVHKTEGSFLEPKLFDEYLGYARSWHKK